MFIVSIIYTASPKDIAALRTRHAQWLQEAFGRGYMKIAGPTSAKDGGILITSHGDRESLEVELDLDPYRIHNAATHSVVQFEPTLTA